MIPKKSGGMASPRKGLPSPHTTVRLKFLMQFATLGQFVSGLASMSTDGMTASTSMWWLYTWWKTVSPLLLIQSKNFKSGTMCCSGFSLEIKSLKERRSSHYMVVYQIAFYFFINMRLFNGDDD